jgi:hypothetical protein
MRFSRDYELTLGIGARAVIVRPPLRIVFGCDKSIRGGINKLTLQIFNLKESNRLQLVKDEEDPKRIPIVLKVGYMNSLETIFKGSINLGSNDRTGPDFVSKLECLDGGFDFLTSFTSRTVRSKALAVDAILEDMPNTDKGKVTQQIELTRPKVLVGNSVQLIEEALNPGESFYIDNEQLFILRSNEVVSSFIPVVSAATGLINTPQRQNQKVTFETLMNPALKLGGFTQLRSKTAPHLNDTYKIETMNYSGDYDGNDWKQAVTCISDDNFKVI